MQVQENLELRAIPWLRCWHACSKLSTRVVRVSRPAIVKQRVDIGYLDEAELYVAWAHRTRGT